MSADNERLVEELLEIADGTDEQILQATYRLGAARVLEVLFTELLSRTEVRSPIEPAVLEYALHGLPMNTSYRVELRPGSKRSEVSRQPVDAPVLKIAHGPLDFVALYRALLGADDEAGKRAFATPPIEGDQELRRRLAACFDTSWDLTDISIKSGTDKWGLHWYTRRYERFFAAIRRSRVRILEIGVGGIPGENDGGASLRMWKHYFPRSLVFGIDIFDKKSIDEQRIRTFQGDQGDERFLSKVIDETGPFDIIVDDGSHFSPHVITSFRTLFPALRNGGFYAIEDLQTSYWPAFHGRTDDFNSPETSVGYLKTLVDGLNHEEFIADDYRPSFLEEHIVAMHFYHNLAIIEKGDNAEGGIRTITGGPDGMDLMTPFNYEDLYADFRQRMNESAEGA